MPDDVSIASFDDDEIASYLRPALTTARLPYEEMGRKAMELRAGPDEPTPGEHLVEMAPTPPCCPPSTRPVGP